MKEFLVNVFYITMITCIWSMASDFSKLANSYVEYTQERIKIAKILYRIVKSYKSNNNEKKTPSSYEYDEFDEFD